MNIKPMSWWCTYFREHRTVLWSRHHRLDDRWVPWPESSKPSHCVKSWHWVSVQSRLEAQFPVYARVHCDWTHNRPRYRSRGGTDGRSTSVARSDWGCTPTTSCRWLCRCDRHDRGLWLLQCTAAIHHVSLKPRPVCGLQPHCTHAAAPQYESVWLTPLMDRTQLNPRWRTWWRHFRSSTCLLTLLTKDSFSFGTGYF